MEVLKRKTKSNGKDTKDKIIELFFTEHLRPVDISNKLKVGMPYITKIIQKDSRYIEEKEARKLESKEKKIKDINKRIDKLYEDKYNGIFEDEDFSRLYLRQIESRKQAEERIKQLKELEEKEDSSVDIDKLVKDFVNMKEITRTMLVSLVDKIEISENKEITIYYKFNILNMGKEDNKLQNVG